MGNSSNSFENRQQPIVNVIAHAIKIIEEDGGFIGNAKSGYAGDANGIRSTKDKVLSIFRQDNVPKVDGNYIKQAMEVQEHFKSLHMKNDAPKHSEFLKSLNRIAQSEHVTEKDMGYVVAMPPSYQSIKDKKEFEMRHSNSDYVGTVGERQNFFLKLLEKKFISAAECELWTWTDKRNNIVKTWVTVLKAEEWRVEVGDCVDLDAFVRKHEANKFNNIRETYINRLKIIDNVGSAK